MDWYGLLRQREIDWLIAQGVKPLDMVRPWIIGAGNVRFEGDVFDPDPEGERALLLWVETGGVAFDVCAWSRRRKRFATYFGRGFALNEDDIYDPASTAFGEALHVHEDPISWLQSGRRGIVILRMDLVHAYLRNVDRISVSDPEFGRSIREALQPPPPRAEILLRLQEVAA